MTLFIIPINFFFFFHFEAKFQFPFQYIYSYISFHPWTYYPQLYVLPIFTLDCTSALWSFWSSRAADFVSSFRAAMCKAGRRTFPFVSFSKRMDTTWLWPCCSAIARGVKPSCKKKKQIFKIMYLTLHYANNSDTTLLDATWVYFNVKVRV